MRIIAVAGARPNFIKIAPLMRELRNRPSVDARLVHTGQHYDARMSQTFFTELEIPRPDIELEVGSGSHAVQTAEIMKRFEPVLRDHTPDVLLVVGDVNSTLACALTAAKMQIPVAHVEAGLRSFDNTMPEEINRKVTDAVSNWLLVSERSGAENLRREGVPDERIFFVGNVMIDTLQKHRHRSESSRILEELQVASKNYCVLTLHRPAAVDDPRILDRTLSAIRQIGAKLPVVFPVHPRTRKVLDAVLAEQKESNSWLRLTEPLGYLDFLKLMAHVRLVFTDSGGVQEETTVLGVPCLTLRENTERPATITHGTNTLVGLDPKRIVSAGLNALAARNGNGRRLPELWDGHAATRVVDALFAGAQKRCLEPTR